MIPAFAAGVAFSQDRWRIDRFVLRMLDARRAELRVSAAHPACCLPAPASADESCDVGSPGICGAVRVIGFADEGAEDDGRDPPDPNCDAFDPFEAEDDAHVDAQVWTAVIPLASLPVRTREALEVASDLYETDELDLSASDEMEELLLALGATTWAPQPVRAPLH